jgi:hypothetical protein
MTLKTLSLVGAILIGLYLTANAQTYFCDDFTTFATGNLVGQQGWTQNSSSSTTLPIQVSGGKVVIPGDQMGDNQDAYKNFVQTQNTSVFAGMIISVSSAAATNLQPAYVVALANFTNGVQGASFANYRLSAQDADGQGTVAFRFSGRTTG